MGMNLSGMAICRITKNHINFVALLNYIENGID